MFTKHVHNLLFNKNFIESTITNKMQCKNLFQIVKLTTSINAKTVA